MKRIATICNIGQLKLEKDTIPKHGGLGSGARRGRSAVRVLFGLRSAAVWCLFGAHSGVGFVAGVADLALGVLAADAVGFFLGVPAVAPVSAIAALGAA